MRNRYTLGACPLCATTDSDLITDRAAARAELEALWEELAGDGASPLPLGQLADTLSFTQPPPLALVRCRGCGLLYRNPRERDVRELYATEAVAETRLAELAESQHAAFAALVRRLTRLNGGAGRGIEVGSYAGAFLAAAKVAGWRIHGTDVNARTVAFLSARGYDVELGELEDVSADGGLDVVACWNCFEQLPDPRATTRAACQLLRPGGMLALRVPNAAFYLALRPHLDGAWRRSARALLARQNLLAFPYRHGFTPASLRQLLEAERFAIVRIDAAAVLPAGGGRTRAAAAALAALEHMLRPITGPPWLELFARRV